MPLTFRNFPVNLFPNKSWFLRVCSTSILKTMWEKGEIARDEQFLLFPQYFLPFLGNFLSFSSNVKLSSATTFNLEESIICRFGKGSSMLICRLLFVFQFGMVETISSGIIDFFPKQLTCKRILVNIVIGIVMAITALPLCLNVSASYFFQLSF